MRIKIVHASISENGTVNGKPGDQTGREVCRRDFYERDWLTVMRARHSETALDMANEAIDAANNDNIGYSQGDRYSLYDYVRDYGIAFLQDVDEPVNCDCSSFIATLVAMQGLKVNRYMWTGSEENDLLLTGEFTSLQYTAGMKLLKGDILIAHGHTAIVVSVTSEEDPEPVKPTVDYADCFDGRKAGIYRPLTSCFIRSGGNREKPDLAIASQLDELVNYGYYTLDERGIVWYLVKRGDLIGFVSSKVVYKVPKEVEE